MNIDCFSGILLCQCIPATQGFITKTGGHLVAVGNLEKAAEFNLQELVAREFNVLAPGWFKTAQNAVLYENKERVDYITERIPLNRPGRPNDLDGTVVFLASDACEYITGQIILVDGGFTTGATKAIT